MSETSTHGSYLFHIKQSSIEIWSSPFDSEHEFSVPFVIPTKQFLLKDLRGKSNCVALVASLYQEIERQLASLPRILINNRLR